MRRTKTMILLTALVTLCLSAMAFAQMSTTDKKPEMMTKMTPENAKEMMMKMSENYKAMEKNLTELEHHLQTMMNMDDMDKLNAEMKQHMEMMRSMNKMMGEQNRMASMMMGSARISHMHQMDNMTGKTMEMKKPESTEMEIKKVAPTEKEMTKSAPTETETKKAATTDKEEKD